MARDCPRALSFATDGQHKFSCGGSGEVITTWSAAGGTANDAAMQACTDEQECTVTLTGTNGTAVTAVCDTGGFDVLTIVSVLFIFVVMLAMGSTLTLAEFWSVLRDRKKGVAIGWCSQFGIMPALSYAMAKIAGLDMLAATGLILCGCAPGGSTSNLFTYWARGDLALSITMSACSTAAAIFMYPLLILIYITGLLGATGDDVAIPFSNIVISLLLIVVPASIGIAIASKSPATAKTVEKLGSGLGVVFLILACITGISDNSDLADVSKYTKLWIIALLFEPLGALVGFGLATAFGMDDASRVAIALETGVQNYGV
jgi:bile acid transporter